MKKILICYIYCNLGGCVSVIKQRLPKLLKEGYQVDTLFKEDNGGKLDLLNAGASNVYLNKFNFANQLIELINENDYDSVVIFDFPDAIEAIPKEFKGKIIYEVHTSLEKSMQKTTTEHLLKANSIIVPSEWSKSWLKGLYPKVPSDQISVCYNIVDENLFSIPDRTIERTKTLEILWIGKINQDKDWHGALRICGLLKRKFKIDLNVKFITGGYIDGTLGNALNQEISDNDLLSEVTWMHNLNHHQVSELYQSTAKSKGILLCSSLFESFALVVHEAIRSGLPVVSTKVGAIPEIIQENHSGFLYFPGDYLTSAEQINELFTSNKLYNKISKQANALVLKKYDNNKLRTDFLNIISTH